MQCCQCEKGNPLTHWGRDKMAAISPTTLANAFFLNGNVRILITISLKFVPKGPINNNPALVQIMAWWRPSNKPLSEPMMVSLLTHICVTRPQWVNTKETKGWLTFQPVPDSICLISVKLCFCYMVYYLCDIIVTVIIMVADGLADIWDQGPDSI